MNAFKLTSIGIFMTFICANALAQTEGESVTTTETTVESSSRKGGFFIEPGLTHESSNSRVSYRDINTDGSLDGYGLSARLGAHFMDSVFAGLDARYSRPDYADTTLNVNTSSDQYNVGPVIGLQTPYLGIRVWGTYMPFAEINPAESNGVKVKYTNGSGYRLGAGVRIAVVSVNLEYQRMAYGNVRVDRVGNTTTNIDLGSARLENESYLLGLSFPIAF
jgi:hypothetical protein